MPSISWGNVWVCFSHFFHQVTAFTSFTTGSEIITWIVLTSAPSLAGRSQEQSTISASIQNRENFKAKYQIPWFWPHQRGVPGFSNCSSFFSQSKQFSANLWFCFLSWFTKLFPGSSRSAPSISALGKQSACWTPSLLNAKSRSDYNLHFYLNRESLYKVSAGTAKWPSAKSQVIHTDNGLV